MPKSDNIKVSLFFAIFRYTARGSTLRSRLFFYANVYKSIEKVKKINKNSESG
nr:MAG TPA: hypothetical protein [Caudoviricetes sp.]